ncbi:MAG: hypothetical protein WBD10_10815 [Acidobacteriaceae bacterium]
MTQLKNLSRQAMSPAQHQLAIRLHSIQMQLAAVKKHDYCTFFEKHRKLFAVDQLVNSLPSIRKSRKPHLQSTRRPSKSRSISRRAHCFSAAFFMTAEPNLDPALESSPGPRRKLWRATLFVIGSAAFSGVALALWNRRELTRIRQTTPPPAPNPPDDEII